MDWLFEPSDDDDAYEAFSVQTYLGLIHVKMPYMWKRSTNLPKMQSFRSPQRSLSRWYLP